MANLQVFFDNFRQEWQSGKDGCLHMECHAGQVWLSFHVHLAHPPHQQQQHQRRNNGPSRLRRRARRAEQRVAANAAARDTVNNGAHTAEKAVQTETETKRLLKTDDNKILQIKRPKHDNINR